MTRSICPSTSTSLVIRGRPRAGRPRFPRPLTAVRVALFATLWVVAGCTTASSGSPTGQVDTATPSTGAGGSLVPASIQPSPELTVGPSNVALPASIVDPVVADIARLAGVSVDQVVVQSAESVTFPDAGLGCPVPGMAYTQVQVDGYRIVAVAGGTTYDYRGTGPGTFRLCTPQK